MTDNSAESIKNILSVGVQSVKNKDSPQQPQQQQPEQQQQQQQQQQHQQQQQQQKEETDEKEERKVGIQKLSESEVAHVSLPSTYIRFIIQRHAKHLHLLLRTQGYIFYKILCWEGDDRCDKRKMKISV